MKNEIHLKSIPDDDLLRRLSELLKNSRLVEAELIAHIAEVDDRRLFARKAAPSMFIYCTEYLHFSEAEAYLRIEVARASRKHSMLLEMLSDGRLHLSGIAVLAPILTEANREEVLARAAYKTKKKIKELVAELAPKPDVPSKMRKLPERREKKKPEPPAELRLDGVASEEATPPTSPPPMPTDEVEPIAPARYKVSFTASAELHDKLERLQALMRSSIPDGDLAAVIEEAVTEKLEKLEAKRYGKTKSPRKTLEEADTSPSSRYISAPIRRAVYGRDGGQCAYVDPTGRRCTETKRLEFHHLEPYGKNGDRSVNNVELRCRAHNLLEAERDYGQEVMDKYRNSGNRVSEPAARFRSMKRCPSSSRWPMLLRPPTRRGSSTAT